MEEGLKIFFKRYWSHLLVGIFVFSTMIFSYLFYKKKMLDHDQIIHSLQESHAKELDDMRKIREEERSKYEENEKKYKEKLQQIEEDYKKAKQELEEKKKTRVEKMVKTYAGKPDELAKKMSDVTGFNLVLPKE